ncbi:nicotinate-nucleotide adenylyltransferase [Litorivivens sp.]|uniref:nicotinate-nucleotide adenylyltransferase n=1 Tax=Litorivivens sp. TaxID=2020868 RepID=UPI0035637081
MNLPAIAILGGTFDPVHIGHVRSAQELCHRLGLNQCLLVPCHLPPHRESPQSSADHRLQMVELAVAGIDGLAADDRELRRSGPSYTVDTLAEIRAEQGAAVSVNFVMGSDAYNNLHTWSRWQSLFEFANVVVMHRDGFRETPVPEVRDYAATRLVDPERLKDISHGAMAHVALTPWPQSATQVREYLQRGVIPGDSLPAGVADYIKQHRLYFGEPENADKA